MLGGSQPEPQLHLIVGRTPPLREVKGCYALLLSCARPARVRTRGRSFAIKAGCYAYVGSALGRGGVGARVSRHLSATRRAFWHIDFLLELCEPTCVVSVPDGRCEPEVVDRLASAYDHVPGFGASDLSAPSSLFRLGGRCSRGVCVKLAKELTEDTRPTILVIELPPTSARGGRGRPDLATGRAAAAPAGEPGRDPRACWRYNKVFMLHALQ